MFGGEQGMTRIIKAEIASSKKNSKNEDTNRDERAKQAVTLL